MKEYNLEGFERGLFELGIKLSEEQKTQFLQYYELLVEWNSFMNLTAITEFDQVITKHFLDSLSLVKVCDVAQAGRILDVGTGAGFPGMPLAILCPQTEFVLLDEPTSNLDPRNQHEVMQLVRAIAREHKISVITVLHDLNLAIRYCDRFMFLKDSEIYAHGGREVMSPEIVEHVYDMHVHIVDCMGIPVLIPFPDVKKHGEDADGTD